MKKFYIIIIVLVIAGVYWFFIRKKKDNETDDKKSIWSSIGGSGSGSIYSNTPIDTSQTELPQVNKLSASKKTYLRSVTGKIKRAPVPSLSLGTVPTGTTFTPNEIGTPKPLALRR